MLSATRRGGKWQNHDKQNVVSVRKMKLSTLQERVPARC